MTKRSAQDQLALVRFCRNDRRLAAIAALSEPIRSGRAAGRLPGAPRRCRGRQSTCRPAAGESAAGNQPCPRRRVESSGLIRSMPRTGRCGPSDSTTSSREPQASRGRWREQGRGAIVSFLDFNENRKAMRDERLVFRRRSDRRRLGRHAGHRLRDRGGLCRARGVRSGYRADRAGGTSRRRQAARRGHVPAAGRRLRRGHSDQVQQLAAGVAECSAASIR